MVQILCLIGLTGMKNPLIMSNWKHLLPNHPEIHKMHDDLMADLRLISENVDAMNLTAPSETRPRACNSFNPKFHETSISV